MFDGLRLVSVNEPNVKETDIPWRITRDHDAIFSVSAQNVKISTRDGNEDLLLRIPIHEIAAICYIRDDDQHILGIKFGANSEEVAGTCMLGVCYCDSRTSSEELCALVHQCFQIVYTEATMQFMDSKLSEAANNSMSVSSLSSATTTTTTKSDLSTPRLQRLNRDYPGSLYFMSQSQTGINRADGTLSTRSLNRRSSGTASESELSTTAAELIQDYMKKVQENNLFLQLHTKLNTDELRRFAQLLKAWHTNLPFSDFCEKVLELYGPDRKYLLSGMKPFIPDKDYAYFETFLERVGVSNGNWNETNPHNRYRRQMSGTSGASGASTYSGTGAPVDEFDRVIQDINDDIVNMQMSVHIDPSKRLDAFPPKST